MAQGSLSELDTQVQLLIAGQLGFLSEKAWPAVDSQMVRIDKILSRLIFSQKSTNASEALRRRGRERLGVRDKV